MSLQREAVVTFPPPTTPSPATPRSEARWRRYDRYAAILVATIVFALVVATLGGDGAATVSGRLGGDYPAFYGAGSIVLDGDVADLYDAARQRTAQAGLLLDEGDFFYFAYPPQVAVAYAPLAALPYRASYLIHTLLMLGALFGAVRLLRPVVPAIDRYPWIATMLALTFYPMFRAVTGGQNTALTALLIALALRLEHDDRPMLAGIAASLLLYKPQFGIPIAGLLLLRPRMAMIRGWLVGTAGFFLWGVAAAGWNWPVEWWREATAFAEINEGVNGFLFVSLPGMVANWMGSASGAGRIVWSIALVAAVGIAVVVWRAFADPVRRWSMSAVAVVLVLPQALFYEAGLLLLAVATTGVGAVAMAVIWTLSWTQLAADALTWSPLGIITPGLLGWLLWRVRSERTA